MCWCKKFDKYHVCIQSLFFWERPQVMLRDQLIQIMTMSAPSAVQLTTVSTFWKDTGTVLYSHNLFSASRVDGVDRMDLMLSHLRTQRRTSSVKELHPWNVWGRISTWGGSEDGSEVLNYNDAWMANLPRDCDSWPLGRLVWVQQNLLQRGFISTNDSKETGVHWGYFLFRPRPQQQHCHVCNASGYYRHKIMSNPRLPRCLF